MSERDRVQSLSSNVRVLRSMILDALKLARDLAARAEDATMGTEDTLLFAAARKAIQEFSTDSDAMQALTSAAMRASVENSETPRREAPRQGIR